MRVKCGCGIQAAVTLTPQAATRSASRVEPCFPTSVAKSVERQAELSGYKRSLVACWSMGLGLVMFVHFTIIFLASVPANAISLDLRPLLVGYMKPIFRQNWNFFAPEPFDHDEFILAQYAVRESGSRTTVTPWYNVSLAFGWVSRSNPFSPVNGSANAFLYATDSLSNEPLAQQSRFSAQAWRSLSDPGTKPRSLLFAERASMAYSRTRPELSRAYRVRIALEHHLLPAFNERAQPDRFPSPLDNVTVFPWVDLGDVAPISASGR